MTKAGVIRDEGRARQLLLFENLRYLKGTTTITGMDIDLAFEFDDLLYCFIEAKYGKTLLGTGQNLYFTRITRRLHGPPDCFAVAFQVQHWVPVNQDIDAAECAVLRSCVGGKWHDVPSGLTLKTAMIQAITGNGIRGRLNYLLEEMK